MLGFQSLTRVARTSPLRRHIADKRLQLLPLQSFLGGTRFASNMSSLATLENPDIARIHDFW